MADHTKLDLSKDTPHGKADKPSEPRGKNAITPRKQRSGDDFDSNFFQDYVRLNTKLFQTCVDSFSNFYVALNNAFNAAGNGLQAKVVSRPPNNATAAAPIPTGGDNGAVPMLNLPEIERALLRLMKVSTRPSADGFADREPFSEDVIRRIMAGYTYVNALLRDRIDLFNYGNSDRWLELNHLVLCGTTPERREQFRIHIEETERRFYDDSVGGIGERIDWLLRHRASTPEALAAGIFLLVTSSPQLYIEGNRRTATLIASYALVRHGLPPLVVTERNHQAFFEIADSCKRIDRTHWDNALTIRREIGLFENFLRATGDPLYLTDASDRART